MSDTKNHKMAIKAIIEAHRTQGKMREIMLQVLADKPSAISNAWEVVKPVVVVKSRKTGDKGGSCPSCGIFLSLDELKYCNHCHCCGNKLHKTRKTGDHGPKCKKCGTDVESENVLICGPCSKTLTP